MVVGGYAVRPLSAGAARWPCTSHCMSLPVLYLMMELQQYGWVMPVLAKSAPSRPAVPPALVTALWIATLTYCGRPSGLMYGTRSAIFMDVTNPAVAATQFTAYMALLNLSIAYSAIWQGIAIEALGYPDTMLIDAIVGLALPRRCCHGSARWRGNQRRWRRRPHARAHQRRWSWGWRASPGCRISLGQGALGAAAPLFETLFTVVFIASALFLLASAAVLTARLARARARGRLDGPAAVADVCAALGRHTCGGAAALAREARCSRCRWRLACCCWRWRAGVAAS